MATPDFRAKTSLSGVTAEEFSENTEQHFGTDQNQDNRKDSLQFFHRQAVRKFDSQRGREHTHDGDGNKRTERDISDFWR